MLFIVELAHEMLIPVHIAYARSEGSGESARIRIRAVSPEPSLLAHKLMAIDDGLDQNVCLFPH